MTADQAALSLVTVSMSGNVSREWRLRWPTQPAAEAESVRLLNVGLASFNVWKLPWLRSGFQRKAAAMQTNAVPRPGVLHRGVRGGHTHSPGAALPSFVWLLLRLGGWGYIFGNEGSRRKFHRIIYIDKEEHGHEVDSVLGCSEESGMRSQSICAG